MRRLARTCFPLALAVLLTLLAGCDSGGADESDFNFLEGSWSVIDIEVNGQSYQSLLETRYPEGVVFAFFESDGLRTFQLVGATESGNTLSIEGAANIDGAGNELFLDAPPDFFVATEYEINSSNRVVLRADGLDATELARTLLGVGVSQDSRVSITILQDANNA